MKAYKTKLGHILPLILTFVFTACQQAPTPIQPGDSTTTTVIETTSGLDLCADGTLNCYVTFPENPDIATILDDPQTAYESCMEQYLIDNGCDDVDPFSLSLAEQECGDALYDDAEEVCSAILDNADGIGFDSDPLAIPENAKAITVKVQTCIDKGPSHFQFKGTNMGTRKFHQGKYRAKKYDGFFGGKKVKLPYQVSMNSNCPSSRKGKVQLTFTPYKGQSAFDLNGELVDTIAFSDAVADSITMEWKAPHLTTAQLPRELYGELDLTQISWILKSIDTPNPTLLFGVPSYFGDWGHVSNGQLYGDSIIYLSSSFAESLSMDFTMVVFVKAQQ